MTDESTLAELMQTDPLKLTRADRAKIIEFYRGRRETFKAEGKAKSLKAKPKSAKPPTLASTLAAQIDIKL